MEINTGSCSFECGIYIKVYIRESAHLQEDSEKKAKQSQRLRQRHREPGYSRTMGPGGEVFAD